MKCIKAVKKGKYSEIGQIERISDKEAYTKVDSGYWVFIPKSEWKLIHRVPKENIDKDTNTQTKENGTQKSKKRQRNEKI